MKCSIGLAPFHPAREESAASVRNFLDATLRGAGQVIFMDSPWTGALNFIALFWAAFAGGASLAMASGALLGTLAATATAYALRLDRTALRQGMYGFNGMLVGAGIPLFLAPSWFMWAVLLLATSASTVVAVAIARLLRRLRLPGLTFPFVFTTWLVLLAAARLPRLPSPAIPPFTAHFGVLAFLHAALTSVAQVFFVDNPVSGAIFLLALALRSRRCAALAATGAITGVAAALLFGADPALVLHGLWAYSAVLTAPAIGCIFLKPAPRTLIYAFAATLATILAQAATATAGTRFGLPPLTFPFVLTTWIFLLAIQGPTHSKAAKAGA